MTIEELLADLKASGWELSWAFQYGENKWRASIIKFGAWNGYDQPDYHFAHCADAPSLAEAIEDAMTKRNDAEFFEGQKSQVVSGVIPDRVEGQSLLARLNLTRRKPFTDRRI